MIISTTVHIMFSKTTRTMFIIAVFSLVGLTVPAGVSQTAFAQSIAEEAVDGTVLKGFFEGEDDDSIGGGGGTGDGTGGGIGDCQTC
jgi:hypothetical protein